MRILLLFCEIHGHHLGTNFSHPQFFSSIKRTISRFMFPSSTIILTVNLRSDRKSSLTLLSCHPSVLLMVVRFAAHLQQGFCLHKNIVPLKGLCSWHCIISNGLLKFSMCCSGTVTEFNTKKMAYRCAMFRAYVFRTRFTSTVNPLLSGLMTGCRWPNNKKSRIIEDDLETTC
jgi:hypothetical protein